MVAPTTGSASPPSIADQGQGTVFGKRQSGMTDLKIADILTDFDVLEIARNEAFTGGADPELDASPTYLRGRGHDGDAVPGS